MALATIEITIAGDPTLKDLARVLEASELIYNRVHVIFARPKANIADLHKHLRGSISLPQESRLRLRHVRSGSILLGLEGFFNELTFLGGVLGLVMLIARIRKAWAEGTKSRAEARKADSEARKTDAEARRIETERRKVMLDIEAALRQGKAKTIVEILMKAQGEFQRLQISVDTEELHRYLSENQRLMDILQGLPGSRRERLEVAELVSKPLALLGDVEIIKIQIK